MQSPNETNRERLLRLIDGGPEALKEVQEERKPAEENKKPVITPVTPVPSAKKELRWEPAGLAKIALVLLLLLLTLRSGSDLIRSFGQADKRATSTAAAVPAQAPAEESPTGLRLVGVDWGEPPVALLEDLKTGKTYFARKNDKIKETRVKEIFKDRVTVAVRGKTLELR